MGFLLQVIAFPFRLIGKLIDLVGRAVVFVLGFVMMVLGVALSIPSVGRPLGIPLFIVGLVLVLRALG